MKPIIKVENLSKQYIIGGKSEPYATLRESLINAARVPFNVLKRRNRKNGDNRFWALKDINFTVNPGEVFLIQLGMFATPIIYPASLVPEKWRWLLFLNPFAGQIEAYRAAFFGLPFNWFALSLSAFLTFVILFYAAFTFKRMEKSFADII